MCRRRSSASFYLFLLGKRNKRPMHYSTRCLDGFWQKPTNTKGRRTRKRRPHYWTSVTRKGGLIFLLPWQTTLEACHGERIRESWSRHYRDRFRRTKGHLTSWASMRGLIFLIVREAPFALLICPPLTTLKLSRAEAVVYVSKLSIYPKLFLDNRLRCVS